MKSHAPTEDEAATRLQARFRGMKTRREMNEKKSKGGVKGAVIAAAAVAVVAVLRAVPICATTWRCRLNKQ